MSLHVPEQYRIRPSWAEGHPADAGNGYFDVPSRSASRLLTIIASNGAGWEHVSVHAIEKGRARTPSWPEMCQIKDLFWDEEDVVIQYHPRASEYVNYHPHTLHLWRPIGQELPTPPPVLVGPLAVSV